jgi:hypothetical protein
MTSNIVQENRGLVRVQSVCNEMEAIWRRTAEHDLGIDGQIEFLESGKSISTGDLVAVQVKSGPSYFQRTDGNDVLYWPTEQHRRYWARLPLAVILVLHNPEENLTIHAAVKAQLAQGGPLRIPITGKLTRESRADLLKIARADTIVVQPSEVLADLRKASYPIARGRLDGVHLLLASVDPNRTYFEIRMARLTALLDLTAEDSGFFIGHDTCEFLFRFAMKVLKHVLTESFIEAFEESWYEEQLVPTLAVPLTATGRSVIGHLWSNIGDYLGVEAFAPRLSDPEEIARLIVDVAQIESDAADAFSHGSVP